MRPPLLPVHPTIRAIPGISRGAESDADTARGSDMEAESSHHHGEGDGDGGGLGVGALRTIGFSRWSSGEVLR